MERVYPVDSADQIFPRYRDTPVSRLLEYHNLQKPHDQYTQAELLIGMCMDNREHLTIPPNFAYILRAGGGNMRPSEFKVSYAIAVGGVRHIALLGHTQCGMVNLMGRHRAFIDGLVEGAGWERASAEDHFYHFSPIFEIGSEIDFIRAEANRLRLRYPKIMVAPMLYKVEDHRLYHIEE